MSDRNECWQSLRRSWPCRYVALFAALAVIIIWIAVIARVNFEREAEMAATMRINQSLAVAFEYHLRHELQDLDAEITRIKEEYEQNGALTPVVQERMRGTRLFILDFKGNLVASRLEPGRQINLAYREYFLEHQAANDGELRMGKPVTSLVDGRPIFQVSRRINYPDGTFAGVVGCGVDPQEFTDFYRDLGLNPGYTVTIIGLDGIVRMRQSGGVMTVGNNLAASPTFQRMLQQSGGSFVDISPFDYQRRIYSYQQMQKYPLMVRVSVPEKSALAGFEQRKVHYYWAGGLGSVLLLVVCGYLIRLIWRQRQADIARHEMEERFSGSFDHAPNGMALVSLDGRLQRVNQALCALFGYSEAEVLQSTVRDVTYSEDRDKGMDLREQLLAGTISRYQVEKRYCHKSGEPILCLQTVSLVRDSRGNPLYFVAQIEDITARKQAEEELRRTNETLEEKVDERTAELVALNNSLAAVNEELQRLTLADGLTGIANRRYFNEYLEREWRTAKRQEHSLGLIMADIDFFKRYNDTYGHQAGDSCLKAVAAILDSGVSRAADLAARYGGEEFAVVLPDTDLAGALHIAEHLRRQVEKMGWEHREAPSGHVTISLGVAALVPTAGSSPEELIKLADQALYQAKQSGRNRTAMVEE